MPYPAGLAVVERPPAGGWTHYEGPVVVLVHGSLDRGASFARTVRRLPEWGFVTYDRRGYQGSRAAGPADASLGPHIDDLLAVVTAAPGDPRRLSAVGHSVGGDVVIGAAVAKPGCFASIGAFEPPMPWLGFRRRRPGDPDAALRPWPQLADDPAVEAEQFFRRMVGDAAWERLSASQRAERLADGPALLADLRSLRGPVPFDPLALAVPAVFGRSDSAREEHHGRAVSWLVGNVPGAEEAVISGTGHGAHLSHPDAFAAFVRLVVARGEQR